MADPSPWETPFPVLLNTWKHHAGALRRAIRQATAIEPLAASLVVIGSELMDLYLGPLTPAEIGDAILRYLEGESKLALPEYRSWLEAGGGYRVVTLGDDSSRWVLRLGDGAGRYIHIHPGRYSPNTRRVRANVLKTAVLVLAHARIHGGDPMDRERADAVRRQYLGLAPLGKELSGQMGLGAVIDLLRSE